MPAVQEPGRPEGRQTPRERGLMPSWLAAAECFQEQQDDGSQQKQMQTTAEEVPRDHARCPSSEENYKARPHKSTPSRCWSLHPGRRRSCRLYSDSAVPCFLLLRAFPGCAGVDPARTYPVVRWSGGLSTSGGWRSPQHGSILHRLLAEYWSKQYTARCSGAAGTVMPPDPRGFRDMTAKRDHRSEARISADLRARGFSMRT